MVKSLKISECESPYEWNEFVNKFGTVHQLFEWKYINQETFGCKCFNLACWNGSKIIAIYPFIIRGYWPINWFVSPTDFGGGPIGDPEGVKELIYEVERRAKKSHVIMNTIRYNDEPFLKKIFENYELIERRNLVINLNKKEEEIWNSLKDKIRNAIRKSKKQELRVEEGNNDNLGEYIKLVKKHSLSVGYRPRDEKFIKSIFKYLNATLLIVKCKDIMVGGCVYINFNGRASAINAARDPERSDLRIGEAQHWGGILYYKEKGFKEYDFMSRNDNYVKENEVFVYPNLTELHRFKLGWRPEERVNYDLIYIYSKNGLKIRRIAANIRSYISIIKRTIKKLNNL